MDKIKWQIKNILRKLTSRVDRKLYKTGELVVISNNCFGGEIYKRLDMKFNTPFIGLFIYGSDYIKLLQRIEFYLSQELKFVETSKWTEKKLKYPIGLLDDVEIHFMHYANKEEAGDKWYRRLERMNRCGNFENFIYKFCDRDGATNEELKIFHSLPFKRKISMGINKFSNDNHIQIKEADNGTVPDGVILYVICQRYLNLYMWLQKGIKRKSWYSSLKSNLDIA